MSKILITGGCGFVGTNLVKRLLQDEHEIFVIDDLSSGFKLYVKHSKSCLGGKLTLMLT